ncbi:hypothetical protein HDK90DRAFT_495730 [Phyllosticta capitalensis]|uniref:Nephrocystin 3-like N-terminal domain-containing protein n=1 Tax=Phyllosticta capitalensis TaxID=121624 RepID=A0ABR1YG98_9PEZI
MHSIISPRQSTDYEQTMKIRKAMKSLFCLGARAPSPPTQSNDDMTTPSCDGILDNAIFRKWERKSLQRGAAKFLWLTGSHNPGKIIPTRILDHLREGPEAVAIFTVSSRNSSSTPDTILRSWIEQLIQKNDVLPHEAQDVRQLPDSNLWPLLRDRLSSCLDGVTLVVDGLDQLEWPDGRSQFLKSLKKRLRDTPARVFIISRDDPDIRGPRLFGCFLLNDIRRCC